MVVPRIEFHVQRKQRLVTKHPTSPTECYQTDGEDDRSNSCTWFVCTSQRVIGAGKSNHNGRSVHVKDYPTQMEDRTLTFDMVHAQTLNPVIR
jgi:hypothetical protein